MAEQGRDFNALKYFMASIRHSRARFSHASRHTTLHPELSLIDNLLMAMEETDFQGSNSVKEAYISQRLERENLRSLASWFQNPRRPVNELTEQERLVAAICHALLRPAQMTLIEITMGSMDPLCFMQIQRTLIEKSAQRHITVHLAAELSWSAAYDDSWDLTLAGPIPRAA